MCGISGVYFKNKTSQKELREVVDLMDKVQEYRGPDDRGAFVDAQNNLGLGHRRLSFIDLSRAGHQPMIASWMMAKNKGQIVITFNGEIYNFEELKKNLQSKNYKFKTKSDTEVILALYAEYGEASFSMLRGMFAFGLWDEKNKKLFLVKDRYGIKPLYYSNKSDRLVFASTVKAVEKSGLTALQKNPKALIGFLLFGSVPIPLTTNKDISALPAGHYLVKSFNAPEKLVKYYDPLEFFRRKRNIGFDEAANETRKILKEAVNLHLISDAPLGIFLSGGLDSSAIAALAQSQRESPITTLSIKFEEKEFSEEIYQRMVAEKIKSNHIEVKITKEDFFGSFPEIFEAMDQPTIDGVNTFFIAKAAQKANIKAVLSGLGGDEVFFGYPSFRKIGLLKNIQVLPKFLKYPLGFSNLFGNRYSKLSYLKGNNALDLYLGIRGLYTPEKVAEILGINQIEVRRFIDDFRIQEMVRDLEPENILSLMEIKFYLQNQLLKDTDFMSMRHSIEVRVPFLDHLLVEYLSSLPVKLKMNSQINKPLLAEAAAPYLPKEILLRRKMGFTFPFEKWLREAPEDLVPASLRDNNLFGRFKKGNLHWSRFWAGFVLDKFI